MQRLAAQKIINDTLLYGELEKLTLEFATLFSSCVEHFNQQDIGVANYILYLYTC